MEIDSILICHIDSEIKNYGCELAKIKKSEYINAHIEWILENIANDYAMDMIAHYNIDLINADINVEINHDLFSKLLMVLHGSKLVSEFRFEQVEYFIIFMRFCNYFLSDIESNEFVFSQIVIPYVKTLVNAEENLRQCVDFLLTNNEIVMFNDKKKFMECCFNYLNISDINSPVEIEYQGKPLIRYTPNQSNKPWISLHNSTNPPLKPWTNTSQTDVTGEPIIEYANKQFFITNIKHGLCFELSSTYVMLYYLDREPVKKLLRCIMRSVSILRNEYVLMLDDELLID